MGHIKGKGISDRIYRILQDLFFVALDSFQMKLPKRNPDLVGRKAWVYSGVAGLGSDSFARKEERLTKKSC